MKSILILFWDICLFRRGPDEVPTSNILTFAILIVFIIFNTVIRSVLLKSEFIYSLLSSLIVLLVFACSLWLGLLLNKCLNRFQQAMTAVLGQDLMISILSLPLLFVLSAEQELGDGAMQVGSIILLMFYGWDLAVKGYIFRRALAVGPVLAFMLAFAIVMGAIMIESEVFDVNRSSDGANVTTRTQTF